MIPKQPETRQVMYAAEMLQLPEETICVAPQILNAEKRVKYDRGAVFSVANVGALFLRAAEGSEVLGDVENDGGLYAASLSRVRAEREEKEWPIYDLSARDKDLLGKLGIERTEFPAIAFCMPGYHGVYGGAPNAQTCEIIMAGAYHQLPKRRLPFISDMDPDSRRYLEELWGIQLHRSADRTLAPNVQLGAQRMLLPNTKAPLVRQRMLAAPRSLQPRSKILEKALADCRE